MTVWAANTAQEAFLIESIAGTPAAATQTLRLGYQTLHRMGERGLLSTVAGFLAQALYARGEYEEAARCSRASEDAAATDDVFSQMLWRTSRAKILVRQGEHERAEALAREAVRLGETHRSPEHAGRRPLRPRGGSPAGRPAGGGGVRARRRRPRLYEQKGQLAGARARSCVRRRAQPGVVLGLTVARGGGDSSRVYPATSKERGTKQMPHEAPPSRPQAPGEDEASTRRRFRTASSRRSTTARRTS